MNKLIKITSLHDNLRSIAKHITQKNGKLEKYSSATVCDGSAKKSEFD